MGQVQGAPKGLFMVSAAVLLTGVFAGGTHAQDKGVIFAGGGVDDDRSVYIGGQYALPGARLGSGLAARGSIYTGRYDYNLNNQNIRGDYTGGELGLAYQWSGGWGYANAAVLGRYEDTDLNPYDGANPRHGRKGSAVVSLDGARNFGPWRVTGYGEYGFRIDDYLARASLTHTVGPRWRVGVEGQAQGDDTYDRQHLGLLAAVRLGSRSELQFSVGDSHQTNRGDRAYAAVVFTKTF